MTEMTQDKKNQLLLKAADGCNIKDLEEALALGAQVDARNSNGNTALSLAAYNGDWDICETLLQANANINITNNIGNAPLHLALVQEHKDTSKKLIEAGADVGAVGADKYTPLIITAQRNMPEICRMIIDQNVDINAKTKNGVTACDFAVAIRQTDIIEMLLHAGVLHKEPKHISKYVQTLYDRAIKAFPAGKLPTAEVCFEDGKASTSVLDACATHQFGTLIGEPLIIAKQYALFEKVWDALPERWRQENQGVYIGYAKLTNGITPPVMNPSKEGRAAL